MPLGLEDVPHPSKNLKAKFGKFRSTVIDYRLIGGAEHAIRDVRRAWNLKEMTACMNHFTL